MAVEKGTKAVISVDFSAYGKRRFNNLRANFVREIPQEEFFNTYAMFRQPILGTSERVTWDGLCAPGSEHFQFVRHLPHECVFLVVGGDKLCGAEDFQDGMIFAFR